MEKEKSCGAIIYNNNKDKKIDIYFLEVEDIEAELIKDLKPEKNKELKK